MAHNFKPRVTEKAYAEQQILKYLDEAVIYECQIKVVTKTLENPDMKDKAMTALAALNAQVDAGKGSLKGWEDFYDSLPAEDVVQ